MKIKYEGLKVVSLIAVAVLCGLFTSTVLANGPWCQYNTGAGGQRKPAKVGTIAVVVGGVSHDEAAYVDDATIPAVPAQNVIFCCLCPVPNQKGPNPPDCPPTMYKFCVAGASFFYYSGTVVPPGVGLSCHTTCADDIDPLFAANQCTCKINWQTFP